MNWTSRWDMTGEGTRSATRIRGFTAGMLALACLLMVAVTPVRAATEVSFSFWNPGAWGPMVERFNEMHPDIRIEGISRPFGQYHEWLVTAVLSGSGPDLMVANPQNVSRFIENGLWHPLDGLIERDAFDRSDYLEGGWAYTSYQGVEYGWPSILGAAFPTGGWVYNEDLFQQNGIPTPTSDWTFADMREYGLKFTMDTNGDGAPDVWGLDEPNPAGFPDWTWSNGGRILSDDHTEFRLLESKALEALQFVADLTRVDGIASSFGPDAFINGSVAIMEAPLASMLNRIADQPAFEWGALAMPHGDGGSVGRIGNIPMGISSQTDHVDEAWTFLKWLVDRETQQWGTFVAQVIVGPVHRNVVFSNQFLMRDHPPYDLSALVLAEGRPLPIFQEWARLDDVVQKAISQVQSGQQSDVATALREIEPQIRSLLPTK